MGLINRKKSGKIINGTKLNVEGQGISTSNKPTPFNNDKPKISTVNNQPKV